MAARRCNLCKDLERDEDPSYTRLFLDFSPSQLIASVESTKCPRCAIILHGIHVFGNSIGSTFPGDVTRVHAYGLFDTDPNATLHLELHFTDDRPKLLLELFLSQNARVSFLLLSFPRASDISDAHMCLTSAIKPRSLVGSDLSMSLRWAQPLSSSTAFRTTRTVCRRELFHCRGESCRFNAGSIMP